MKNQKYQPTQKEILNEMGYQLGENLKKFKEKSLVTIKNTKDFFSGYLTGVVDTIALTHVGNSVLEKVFTGLFEEKNTSVEETSESNIRGASIGAITSLIAQGYIYYKLVDDGHPETLLIPVATNIASGLYEWQKRSKLKIIERKSLEQTANNPFDFTEGAISKQFESKFL